MASASEETEPLITKAEDAGDEEAEEDLEIRSSFFRSPSSYPTFRAYMWDLVEGAFDSWLEYFIMFLIIVNVLAFMLGTLIVEGEPPCYGKCVLLNDAHEDFFEALEAISVIIFTIEYCLRIWSSMEDPELAAKGPFWGRIAYATSFYPLVDFFAIFPWYLTAFGLIEDYDFTTAIRVLRLVRLLKAERYLNAFSLLGQVLAENGSLLIVTLYYSGITWFLMSTALYFTERDNPELAVAFSSVPTAMFPTIVMLTGEFPYAEFTVAGRFIAGSIAVIAVAIFAVPTGVIGSGFIKAIERSRGEQFTVDD